MIEKQMADRHTYPLQNDQVLELHGCLRQNGDLQITCLIFIIQSQLVQY